MNRSRSGFTIVELLIVIVVIGILAAITIVAFNGVQTKSNVAKKQSTISQVKKILKLDYTEHEHFPATVDDLKATLGPSLLKDLYVSTGEGYGCQSDQVFTKDQICIQSQYYTSTTGSWYSTSSFSIVYWDDIKKKWILTAISTAEYSGTTPSYFDESTQEDLLGSGDHPMPPPA